MRVRSRRLRFVVGTYDEIELAPEEALAKVRQRIRNNVQIFRRGPGHHRSG